MHISQNNCYQFKNRIFKKAIIFIFLNLHFGLIISCANLEEDFKEHYFSRVSSFKPGLNAGFGLNIDSNHSTKFQNILGPPKGLGSSQGSLDVISLGNGGEITLFFAHALLNKEGVDLKIFENVFEYQSFETTNNSEIISNNSFFEYAKIGVSTDGITYSFFKCSLIDNQTKYCAGQKPVFANSHEEALLNTSGGDYFDFNDIKIERVHYVKIIDMNIRDANDETSLNITTNSAGFDLDAVIGMHPEK